MKRKVTASSKYKELKAEMAEIKASETVFVQAINKLKAQATTVLARKAEVKTAMQELSGMSKKSIDFKIEDTEEGLQLDLESGEAETVIVDGDVIKGNGGEEEGLDEGRAEDFDFENIDEDPAGKPEGMPGEEPTDVVNLEKRMKFLKSKYDTTKDVKAKERLNAEFKVLSSKRKRILSVKK